MTTSSISKRSCPVSSLLYPSGEIIDEAKNVRLRRLNSLYIATLSSRERSADTEQKHLGIPGDRGEQGAKLLTHDCVFQFRVERADATLALSSLGFVYQEPSQLCSCPAAI